MIHRRMIGLAVLMIICLSFSEGEAFSATPSIMPWSSSFVSSFEKNDRRHPLLYAAGKGFGNVNSEPPLNPKKTAPAEPAPTSVEVATSSTLSSELTAGQKVLAEMRRQRAEAKDAELRKLREMMLADQQVKETPAAIPEKVAQRMGARMLGFVGVPLFLGLGSFVAFWYFATYKNVEFQPGLVAATTIAILGLSLMGITYSVMSTSWDEEREGDLIGVDEFRRNVANIKEGLDRSKENAILRDKMAGIDQGDLGRAMAALENNEAKKAGKEAKSSSASSSSSK